MSFYSLSTNAAAGFFGFPTWYEYLPTDPTNGSPAINNINDFWMIGAAVLEMIIRLAALMAVALFIYYGARMMTSQGNPERVAASRDGMLKSTIGLTITVLSANLVGLAASAFSQSGTQNGIPVVDAGQSAVASVLQYVFAIIGGLSVLMVVIGGIRYIVSTGDPQRIATSKNTIIYAVIGLAISVSAYLIVGFIFRAIGGEL